MTIDEFVKWLYPAAKKGEINYKFTIAQAALETGWGKSKIGRYNLFGVTIGSSWTGKKMLVQTTEILSKPYVCKPGESIIAANKLSTGKTRYTVKRWFRDYDTLEEALKDHQAILMKSGYKDAWAYRNDPREYAKRIVDSVGCKYATDPLYAQTMSKMITSVENSLKRLGLK